MNSERSVAKRIANLFSFLISKKSKTKKSKSADSDTEIKIWRKYLIFKKVHF